MGEVQGPSPGARFVLVNPGGTRVASPWIYAGEAVPRSRVQDIYFVGKLKAPRKHHLHAFVLAREDDPDALYLVAFDVSKRGDDQSGSRYYYATVNLRWGLCAKIGRSDYICPTRAAADMIRGFVDRVVLVPVRPFDPLEDAEVREAFRALVLELADELRRAAKAGRREVVDRARALVEGPEGRRLADIYGGRLIRPLADAVAEATEVIGSGGVKEAPREG